MRRWARLPFASVGSQGRGGQAGSKRRAALVEPKKNPRLLCRRGFGVETLAMTYSRMLSAHYHRRMRVSLPSSGWDRVVPRSYYHQGEGGGSPLVPEWNFGAHALIGSWDVTIVRRRSTCRRGLRLLEVIWSSHTDH
jgi:hypothetical protein